MNISHTMQTREALQALAERSESAAPYGFEQFEQRSTRTAARRHAGVWSATGSALVLAVVSLVAVVTQAPPQPVVADSAVPVMRELASDFAAATDAPALVDLGQLDVTAELEDHIALLDDALSAARLHAMPAERVRQMESTRAQLNESLQQVSYAQSMLSL
jgi:hypothetical protein